MTKNILVGALVLAALIIILSAVIVVEQGNILCWATEGNHLYLMRWLIVLRCDVNARNEYGRTALHEASLAGNIQAVRMLLSEGADVTARASRAEEGDRGTPLHSASKKGRMAVAKLLICEGADVNAKDIWGNTPIDVAVAYNDTIMARYLFSEGATLNIFTATALGEIDFVRRAVQSMPALVNAVSVDHKTPLHLAAIYRRSEIASLLIKNGANIDATSLGGETALLYAVRSSSGEVVRVLLEGHADPTIADSYGITPLHEAAWQGDSDLFQLLVGHGGDVRAQDVINGLTPLEIMGGHIKKRNQ